MTPLQQMRAITLGSGALAGAAVGLLIYAYLPQVSAWSETRAALAKQPVFVEPAPTPMVAEVAAPAPSPAASPAPVAAPPTPAETVAIAPETAPLAVALAQASAGPTRSIDVTPTATINPQASQAFADGLSLLASGEIAPARIELEKAARGGEARAWLALGESYDPATLGRLGAVGVKGDPVKAKDCYGRAEAAGLSEARQRTAQLTPN
jgi:hypothetical protein